MFKEFLPVKKEKGRQFNYKMGKHLNSHFTQKMNIQMSNKYMNKAK